MCARVRVCVVGFHFCLALGDLGLEVAVCWAQCYTLGMTGKWGFIGFASIRLSAGGKITVDWGPFCYKALFVGGGV